MGYEYGRSASGRMTLSCDGCGTVGGVRKRTCPFKVFSSGLRSGGVRQGVSYCYPPALCAVCFKGEGGSKGIHVNCDAGARVSQARDDEERRRLEAGESHVTSAFGSWHETVPSGFAGVVFAGLDGNEVNVLIAVEEYHQRSDVKGMWLGDYADTIPWCGPR